MSSPTVPVSITAKELRVLSDLLGNETRCTTLRDKLDAAAKEVRIAAREVNRQAKIAKRERNRA